MQQQCSKVTIDKEVFFRRKINCRIKEKKIASVKAIGFMLNSIRMYFMHCRKSTSNISNMKDYTYLCLSAEFSLASLTVFFSKHLASEFIRSTIIGIKCNTTLQHTLLEPIPSCPSHTIWAANTLKIVFSSNAKTERWGKKQIFFT